ncbi:MAG: N-acetylmuramoyl-L-alanine amidase [bacterium]|nr:N-acetylmuramoyl-L-alanine amidase [bacterium]
MVEKIKWIGVLLFLIALIYGGHRLSVVVASNILQDEKIVVIDAGHGGDDPGKIGINNALEKEINLQIAKEIKKYLEKAGITVVMTRENDSSLKNSKAEDMRERVKIIDESKAKIAVSIHQNSFPSEAEKGAQVFYFSESEEGVKIAQILQNHLKILDPENKREIKENNSYFLLKRTKTPTVIVECGFLSNWAEAEKLTETEYQKEIAQVISEGILAYMNQE